MAQGIATRPRSFELVVNDVRKCTFSICRLRRQGQADEYEAGVLGSGFFISPTHFLTNYHVINPPRHRHQDGDHYQFIRNDGQSCTIHHAADVHSGKDLFLYPEVDVALIKCSGARFSQDHFVNLEFSECREGKEIGVYGYPLGKLGVMPDGQPDYRGLIPRVGKGVITSNFLTNVALEPAVLMQDINMVEVNFLFVPGNSGGPVFDAHAGSVLAVVHGFNAVKVKETIEKAEIDLVTGMSKDYVRAISAIYSYAIHVSNMRALLKEHGLA